jgi:hypothetical protein
MYKGSNAGIHRIEVERSTYCTMYMQRKEDQWKGLKYLFEESSNGKE